MFRRFRSKLLTLAVFTAVSLVVMVPTHLVRAQDANICYDLLEPIWNPPSYTDVVECMKFNFPMSLLLPQCSLPTCRLHPECAITKQVLLNPGFWQNTRCEVLSPDKILDLFLRGQLRELDNTVLPGVQETAYTHVQILRAAAIPVPSAVQLLLKQLIDSKIAAGMPAFNMEHVQRAKLLPRSTATASLYLRSGFGAITLNDLIIINDDLFATLMNTSIPANATLYAMRSGSALSSQFTNAFTVLAHELVHVRQYDEMGADAFLNNYLLETLTIGYGNDSFEREAAGYQQKVQDFLNGTRGTFFADVTGDGKADAIVVNNSGVSVRPAAEGVFSGNEPWTTNPFFGNKGTFFADVTGDGKADAIVVNDSGVTVRRSNGSVFTANENWTQKAYFGSRGTFFADVTGDSKADAIVVNDSGVTVRRSNGSIFTSNENWTQEAYFGSRGTFFADVTGDGKADAIVVNDSGVTVRRSNGSIFTSNENWTQEAYFGSRGTFFADVTGDSKADAIVVNDSGITVRRSNGSVFTANENWTQKAYFGSRGTFFADATGDSKADAIVVNDSGITVRPSTGSVFSSNEPWTTNPYFGN